MAVEKLAACLTFFVLYSCFAYGGLQDLFGSEYGEAVRRETYEKVFLYSIKDLEELSGGVYSQFSVPNWLHTKGTMHSAIYRYNRDGKSRLIKVILEDSKAHISDDYFRGEIFGMLLSSHVGGPEVYHAGRITVPDGRMGYYVEMEELFANQTDTYTYKGLGSKIWPMRILALKFPNDAQLLKIAKMIRINLERGILIGNDPDLIFSGSDVRWLDTTAWEIWNNTFPDAVERLADISRFDFNSQRVLYNYGSLIKKFFRLKKSAGRFLIQALKREVAASPVWTDLQKTGILVNMREVIVHYLDFTEEEFDSLMRSSSETVSQKCMRLLGAEPRQI